ncbi:hypothetical protein CR513_39625, partial [Mucuna pruriens]
MDIPENRRWMYSRLDANKHYRRTSSLKEYTSFYNLLLHKKNFSYKTNHGEQLPQFPPLMVEGSYYASGEQREEFNPYEQLIMDHAGPSIGEHIENMEENPNPEAQNFFDMLAVAQALLSEGCDNQSKLLIY